VEHAPLIEAIGLAARTEGCTQQPVGLSHSLWRPGNRGRCAVSLVAYGVGQVPWYDGRDGMYSWIWRHLPGNGWVKALISLVLVTAVVYVHFPYVFPLAEPLLPFNDVTVDNQ
jgi:hypothetical protein